MTDRVMSFVRGVGSVLDLWPAPVRIEDLPCSDASELFSRSWETTGRALWAALDGAERESQEASAAEDFLPPRKART